MLERTVAKLEPCTLPRSLPSTGRPRRNLHTGFWQHGAAALDLSSIWSSSTQVPQQDVTSTSARGLPERLLTSAFLLDFLYPKGTVAFLRRLTPASIDRPSNSVARQPAGPLRLFTSAARSVVDTTESSGVVLERSDSSQPEPANDPFEALERQSLSRKQEARTQVERTPAERKRFLARYQAVVDPDAADGSTMTPADLIKGLMARTDTEFYGPIWELWLMLEPEEKAELRKDILKYFHRSFNLTDAERILLIFSELEFSSWSPSQLTAAVAAHLRLGEVEDALQLYAAGLGREEVAFVSGMGHLLQHAFQTLDWELVVRIYDPWQKACASRGEQVTFGILTPLFSVPNLGARVLEFRKRLAFDAEAAEPEAAIDFDHIPPDLIPGTSPRERLQHFNPLLRVLAKLGIQQPCKAKNALDLLRVADDSMFYYKYLTAAIERGDTDAFSEVYREYRQLPDGKFSPSRWILGSILEVFIPHDVQGVEMIYEDFHTLFGGLNPYASNKFLNFYAARGDVESTQKVWDALVLEGNSKEALRNPKTFVPLLHAHKCRGDAKAVRRLFADISTKYGIEPDVACWNVLLASVVSLGNFGDALDLFGQLRKAVSPNATSFGTIMAMTAGRGDLDFTLLLFEDAKKVGVVIDTAVTSAVVEAYCRTNQFQEARRICLAAAEDVIPGDHAHLWNCLIRRKSHERDLPELYALINEMKSHNITWNSATEEAVLQALSRAGRMIQAHALLRRAIEEKSFPVTDRHFSIVIEGARRTRQWTMVLALCRKMEEAGFSVSGKNQIIRAQAESAMTGMMAGDGRASSELGMELISEFEEMFQVETQNQQQPLGSTTALLWRTGDAVGDNSRIDFVYTAVETLAQVPDLPAIRALLGMYAAAVTEPTPGPSDIPLPILVSMMRADMLEQDYSRVKETWRLAFNKARELGMPSSGELNTILPSYQHSLSVPLAMMQEIYVVEHDAEALMVLVDELRSAGFVLNSIDWNITCLNLAKLGKWVQACQLFEEVLMPRWLGWKARRIIHAESPNSAPWQEKLRGRAADHLRPNSETLTFLTDEYHRLRRDALWDTSCETKLATVASQCPRLMHAFRTALGHSDAGMVKENFHRQWRRRPSFNDVEKSWTGQYQF